MNNRPHSVPVTLDQVREFIRHASKPDLSTLTEIVKSRWKHLEAEVSMDFVRGDRVSWVHGKRTPRVYHGTVVAADGRWVYVNEVGAPVGAAGWNCKVAPTLLRKTAG